MRVSIFGMGYVGAVSAGCLADLGHDIVGVDVSQRKVDMINAGHSPVVEEKIDDLIKSAVAKGQLKASQDSQAAVASTDVSFISVGTPSGPNGSPSLTALDAVTEEIGRGIKAKSGEHTVVLRSTVPPGTTEERVGPALEKASGRTLGNGLHVVFNPEFLREGSSVRDFYDPPFTVIGSPTEPGYRIVEEIYGKIKAPVIRTDTRIAESVKCLSNAFHAVKITFANEVGAILKNMNIDSRAAMSIFCQDKHLNISPAYLRPGFAYGGSCLPKDLSALVTFARNGDVDVPFLRSVSVANDVHINRALEMVLRRRKRKVALFGLSFKPGTDDLRDSPLVTLSERLIGKGYDLTIFDRFVESSRLMGKNKEFIEHEIPHFERFLTDDPAVALAKAEVIVIGHVSKPDAQVIIDAYQGQAIIDLAGVAELRDHKGLDYEGICW